MTDPVDFFSSPPQDEAKPSPGASPGAAPTAGEAAPTQPVNKEVQTEARKAASPPPAPVVEESPRILSTATVLDALRKRILAGQEYTREEVRQAVMTLRGDRMREVQEADQKAQAKAKRAPRAPKGPPPSLDDLL